MSCGNNHDWFVVFDGGYCKVNRCHRCNYIQIYDKEKKEIREYNDSGVRN